MRRAALLAGLALLAARLAAGQDPAPERSLADLLKRLEHASPAVRLGAVRELGRRREAKALAPLVRRLGDEDPTVRAHAAEALRALGDERAVPSLARALEDADPTVRARAALAVGDLGGKYVLPALTRLLRDTVAVVRAAAVRALGEIGDPLSLDAVLEAQREEEGDADFAVSAAAIVASAKLAGPAGLAASLGLAKEKLARSWFLRACAAHAVGLAGDRERIPYLEALLARDEDPRVSQAAAGALAALGAREALLGALELGEGFRRRAAVAGLASLEGEKVEEALVRAAADESPGVVLEAGAALLGRGRSEAFPVVIALLEGDASIWLGALEVLERRTGLRFGRNPARWKEWFEGNRRKLLFDPEKGVYGTVR